MGDEPAAGSVPEQSAGSVPERSAGLLAVHHVGVTVTDLERSLRFWGRLTGASPRDRRSLAGPGVGRLVGYPDVRIDRAWLDFPGGVALELLQYLEPIDPPYPEGTAHPGNIHLCLGVDDVDVARDHALACGARPVGGPIDVAAGPQAGARVAYVRDPDGITIELFQSPDRPR
ncbi:MAG: VOC family protein [Actinomycetota bacterium]|nr:VOC family protein [Actinomycetota bacterium]